MKQVSDDELPDRDEQAASWCLSMAGGELRGQDGEAFDRWIADPENALAFNEAVTVWNMADHAATTPQLIHMRSAALDGYRQANRLRWTRRLSPRRYGIGAIVAMLLMVISFTLISAPVQRFETGIGERRVAMLGDGSKLSLDADTLVDVRLGKGRRELTLVRGRAKFDVAHDALRPFTVTAGNRIVVATGTSFSVELINHTVHVLLYQGHVAVLDKHDDRPLQKFVKGEVSTDADQTLIPGKELVASIDKPEAAIVPSNDASQTLSWEAGQLNFDDEPLASAVERVNRYSRQKIAIGDPEVAALKVTGVFVAGDSNAFVEGVSVLNALHVRRSDGETVLTRK